MKILQFPLTRLVLFFIVGIVFANYVAVDFQIILYFSISIFVLILVRFFLNRKKNIRSIFDGFLYFTLFFFIGIWTSWMHNPDTNSKTFTKQISEISEPQKLEVILREKLKNSKQNQRFVAIVEQTNNLKSSGKIILNIDSENLKFPLKVGQKLRFDSKIYLPKKPANPDQFDYGRYLKNKGILAQTFVEPNQLQISTITTKDIWYYSAVIKNRIKNNLEKSGFAKNELSVILALFMGDRDSISAEIKTDYQLSGAMHILAVSGLHVGILMIFIGFFLDFLPHSKYKPFIKLVVILLVLWSFAFLAGLSASVVRAVTMFSFVAIGNAMQKRTAIFHTLLVSMFLILLFQPTFLFDVGFQLSYCALFFILWLQPLFASIWKPRNKIVTYFWDIFTVSFAAQIGVFPLSLYYFHQFPGLFFITNLFVIPLVFAIMLYGFGVFVWSAFGVVPLFISKILEFLVFLMDSIVSIVASFESFIFRNIPFTILLLLSTYFLIISVSVWFKNPNFKKTIVALLAVITLQTTYFITQKTYKEKEDFIVFNVWKKSAIGIKTNSELKLFTSDSINENYVVLPYKIANFVTKSNQKPLQSLYYFNHKKILIIDSEAFEIGENPDVLVLCKSPKLNLEKVLELIKPKQIVADGSNYKSYVKMWEKTCREQKIQFHNTSEMGFYRLEKK